MIIREKAEERDIESCFPGGPVPDQWRKLVVISNEDKLVCESQWAETGGERNLRSFVDDAIVELASGEQSAMMYCVKCLQGPTRLNIVLTGQLRDKLSRRPEES